MGMEGATIELFEGQMMSFLSDCFYWLKLIFIFLDPS